MCSQKSPKKIHKREGGVVIWIFSENPSVLESLGFTYPLGFQADISSQFLLESSCSKVNVFCSRHCRRWQNYSRLLVKSLRVNCQCDISFSHWTCSYWMRCYSEPHLNQTHIQQFSPERCHPKNSRWPHFHRLKANGEVLVAHDNHRQQSLLLCIEVLMKLCVHFQDTLSKTPNLLSLGKLSMLGCFP